MNINVNTSPLNCTPAESNSNLMVKQGAPDIFTPLMRVSPQASHREENENFLPAVMEATRVHTAPPPIMYRQR